MEKLFQDFEAIGIDEWVDKIYKDLKDKPKDLLTDQPEFDLNVKSFYHRDEVPVGHFPNGRSVNQWKNRRFYSEATNKLILNDLNEGIDCLGLQYVDQATFEAQTKDVQFEFIDADLTFDDILKARAFVGADSIRLNFDIIGQGLTKGEWPYSMVDFSNFYKDQQNHQNIWISGSVYGEAGSSCSQELAFTAAHVNEYLHQLTNDGISLEEINRKLIIELSATEDFFANIAKFKLINYIVQLVFKGYDENYKLKPITIYAKTSARYLAINDYNNNILRQTTMAMSALIGGCDVINIQTLSTGKWEADQVMERMAKNIPLILKEESYFDKVADAAEGAYYIENLCTQMIRNAWNLFKLVEEKGGLIKSAEQGFLQSQLTKNQEILLKGLNDGNKTFLGVNKYPSNLEDWKEIPAENYVAGEDFSPLVPYRLELKYRKEQHAS